MGTRVEPISSLVAAGNTDNPCLIVLKDKGYRLWLEKGDEDRNYWCAEKGGASFMAHSGPELLGLVVMWEHLGKGWNRQQPDHLGELYDKMDDEPVAD